MSLRNPGAFDGEDAVVEVELFVIREECDWCDAKTPIPQRLVEPPGKMVGPFLDGWSKISMFGQRTKSLPLELKQELLLCPRCAVPIWERKS